MLGLSDGFDEGFDEGSELRLELGSKLGCSDGLVLGSELGLQVLPDFAFAPRQSSSSLDLETTWFLASLGTSGRSHGLVCSVIVIKHGSIDGD
jgi:hypothetical protein